MYFKKFIYYQQVALSRSKPPYGNCSEGESFYQTYGVRYTMSVGFFPEFLFIPLECSFHLKMSKYLDLCHLLGDLGLIFLNSFIQASRTCTTLQQALTHNVFSYLCV